MKEAAVPYLTVGEKRKSSHGRSSVFLSAPFSPGDADSRYAFTCRRRNAGTKTSVENKSILSNLRHYSNSDLVSTFNK